MSARPLTRTTKTLVFITVVLLAVVAFSTVRLAFYSDNQKDQKEAAQGQVVQEQGEKKGLAEEVDRICATKTAEAANLRKRGKCDQAKEIIQEPIAGPAGEPGQNGATGPVGPRGPMGPSGPPGPPGATGKQGPPPGCVFLASACIGSTGPKGDPGLSIKGDKGDPGESIKGDKGEKGEDSTVPGPRGDPCSPSIPECVGPKGPPGNDGEDGKDAFPFVFVFTVPGLLPEDPGTTYSCTVESATVGSCVKQP